MSYFAGGLIPLLPYILTGTVDEAFRISIVVTGFALVAFGAVKGHSTGVNRLKSAAQTLTAGGLAAGAAFGLARFFS